MPPPLALALTLLIIGYLLRRDAKEQPRVSKAAWIPVLWLMINGSRQVSQWIDGPTGLSAQALSDGNAVDKVVYSSLMAAATWILVRRRVRVAEILRSNWALALLLFYAGLSVLWSDFPLISLKRWIKALGDPLMVLVLWSDPVPTRAITATLKRCAYVFIPLSVLFCKYYENVGRSFDSWGRSGYTGVATDKNMLGYLLFAFGLFFLASFLNRRASNSLERSYVRTDRIISLLMLALIYWLITMADSKTATLSLVVGIFSLIAVQSAAVRRHFLSYAITTGLLVMLVDGLFSIKSAVLEASGRDPTFTGRTTLWETLLREPINPFFGTGYGGFWLGERLSRFWEMYPTSPPIQAHNGYIEVYLNLGVIGLGVLITVLWKGLRTIQGRATAYLDTADASPNDRILAAFGLAYGVAYLFYNVTEATFQGMNFLFTIFLFLAFEPSPTASAACRARGESGGGGTHREIEPNHSASARTSG